MNKGGKEKEESEKEENSKNEIVVLLLKPLPLLFFFFFSHFFFCFFSGLQKELTHEEMLGMGWIDKDGKARHDFKNIAQGAATSVWAATTPLLEGKGGLYCEDCHIGKENDYNIFFILLTSFYFFASFFFASNNIIEIERKKRKKKKTEILSNSSLSGVEDKDGTNPSGGYRPWTLNAEGAKRLWELSEQAFRKAGVQWTA